MRVDDLKESFEILRQQGHSSRLMASEGSNSCSQLPACNEEPIDFQSLGVLLLDSWGKHTGRSDKVVGD